MEHPRVVRYPPGRCDFFRSRLASASNGTRTREESTSSAALGLREEILASGLFDAEYYLATYSDVRTAGVDPLDHYIAFGAAEGRKPNCIFDPHYYRRSHLTNGAINPDPLVHYIREGEALGLRPAPNFDPSSYLSARPSIAAAGLSPLWHRLHGDDQPSLHERIKRSAPVRIRKPLFRRWERPATGTAGVNFIGPVEVVSGLGTSARGYLEALRHAHVKVNVRSWTLGFEHQRLVKADFPPVARQPINIVHLNADCSFLWLPKLSGCLSCHYYNVAIWYWELSSFRPEWMSALARFDEVWCASSFTTRSIGAVSVKPVKIVRPAVSMRSPSPQITRRDFGLDGSRFTFSFACDSGSNLTRKNPAVLVRAFRDEFQPEDGAALLLKLSYSANYSSDVRDLRRLAWGRPDIVIMDRLLTDEQFATLMTLVDCYVSPHRSEGLGLTVIEAMLAGKPVIGTPYGGVTDFLRPDTGVLLDYNIVEIEKTAEPYPAGYVWADPKISSIRSAMRWVFGNREQARSLGRSGQRFATTMFSAREAAACLKLEIDRIWSEHAPSGTAEPSR